MPSLKGDSHLHIRTILCVLCALIFGALFVRLELKLAHYEERLNTFEEAKMNCCEKGKDHRYLHHLTEKGSNSILEKNDQI